MEDRAKDFVDDFNDFCTQVREVVEKTDYFSNPNLKLSLWMSKLIAAVLKTFSGVAYSNAIKVDLDEDLLENLESTMWYASMIAGTSTEEAEKTLFERFGKVALEMWHFLDDYFNTPRDHGQNVDESTETEVPVDYDLIDSILAQVLNYPKGGRVLIQTETNEKTYNLDCHQKAMKEALQPSQIQSSSNALTTIAYLDKFTDAMLERYQGVTDTSSHYYWVKTPHPLNPKTREEKRFVKKLLKEYLNWLTLLRLDKTSNGHLAKIILEVSNLVIALTCASPHKRTAISLKKTMTTDMGLLILNKELHVFRNWLYSVVVDSNQTIFVPVEKS